MISQKAISAKLYYTALEELEKESRASGLPKNRIINLAIMSYSKLADAKRAARAYGQSDVTREIIEQFVRDQVPGHSVLIDS